MNGIRAGFARLIGRLSRASGKGGGTTLPGRVLLRLDPQALNRLGSRLSHGSTLISATNGKTTTASMLATILSDAGRRLVHNRSGSNMTWGVATALLEQKGDEGLFEVDEAWLPEIAARLGPGTILLGNLFRDQLDRYGETDALADAWVKLAREAEGNIDFVLNADDPLVADIGRWTKGQHSFFGIEDKSQALPEIQHAHDAKACRVCGHALEHELSFVGHMGHYSCPGCGMKRPTPDVFASEISLHGMRGLEAKIVTPEATCRLELPLPGLYNLYNALGAIATARRLGVGLEGATASLSGMKAVFGRVERIQMEQTELSILLIKNPAGANEVIRTLALEPGRLSLWLALNDRIADGRDISWIWDADFEMLSGRVESIVCTGTRASEMALRLKYAGLDEQTIQVVDDLEDALDTALAASPEQLFAMPTYTALLELRGLLADRGKAERYWAD